MRLTLMGGRGMGIYKPFKCFRYELVFKKRYPTMG